jgi:hypothetical protein
MPFPFGVGNFPATVGQVFQPSELRSAHFWVGVGNNDTNPADVPRQFDPFQGDDRLDRARAFVAALDTLDNLRPAGGLSWCPARSRPGHAASRACVSRRSVGGLVDCASNVAPSPPANAGRRNPEHLAGVSRRHRRRRSRRHRRRSRHRRTRRCPHIRHNRHDRRRTTSRAADRPGRRARVDPMPAWLGAPSGRPHHLAVEQWAPTEWPALLAEPGGTGVWFAATCACPWRAIADGGTTMRAELCVGRQQLTAVLTRLLIRHESFLSLRTALRPGPRAVLLPPASGTHMKA